MKLVRLGFALVLGAAIFGVGCCGGTFVDQETRQEKESGLVICGRVLRDKAKKNFVTGWGFRSADKENPTFYLLKKYPEEFDSAFNAPFMNERRAKLKLKLVGRGKGVLADPIPAEILDVVDISRRLDGN